MFAGRSRWPCLPTATKPRTRCIQSQSDEISGCRGDRGGVAQRPSRPGRIPAPSS
jgi:hypothetical protein